MERIEKKEKEMEGQESKENERKGKKKKPVAQRHQMVCGSLTLLLFIGLEAGQRPR